MSPFLFAVALLPIIVFIILLFFKETSLLKASVSALTITALLAFGVWQIIPSVFFSSVVKGSFVALDIALIILGAIFFLGVLKDMKTVERVARYLESFSKDYRIQVIMLAWFFEAFLEGTAGFGTATAITAPLLIGIGISPLRAVIITLIGNSAPVVFGAVGAPIRVGFTGFDISTMPVMAAAVNLVGIIIPLFIAWFAVAGEKDRFKSFREIIPFALFSGISFGIFSLLASFIGVEFPSIIGAIAGIIVSGIALKTGLFIPKEARTIERKEISSLPRVSFLKTFFPYIILLTFLIAGKIFLGNISVSAPFGIDYRISLFNPGTAFIIAGIVIAIFFHERKKVIFTSIADAAKRSLEPFAVIASVSIMVKIMADSGINGSGLPSFMELISKPFETTLLPLIAPFVGAFGSFLTGSATVSNIMFGNFLYAASGIMGFDWVKILVLALVGASAGNMIALADILASEAGVGLKHKEKNVVLAAIVPCLVYVLLVSFIGLIIA